jgi:hypothetical protein
MILMDLESLYPSFHLKAIRSCLTFPHIMHFKRLSANVGLSHCKTICFCIKEQHFPIYATFFTPWRERFLPNRLFTKTWPITIV